MRKYANLNQLVQDYKISKEGGVKELKTLQKRLSNVPIVLERFKEQLEDDMYSLAFSDLITGAELCHPQMRIWLLDELLEEEEADDIAGRIVLPFPIIYISGKAISKNFYQNYKHRLNEFIVPDTRDKTARVLSDPECIGAAILFEREDQLNYIEIFLTKTVL